MRKEFYVGDNEDFACIKLDDDKDIAIPHEIDDIVKAKCGIERVVDVQLDFYNTFVICE